MLYKGNAIKFSTTSAYCHEHQHTQHGWFQRWHDCGGDQCKSRQDRERKQRQSASEGIIKKVKGQTTEPVKTKVPASDKHYWLAK